MKRNTLRKSLQKIKKELHTQQSKALCFIPSDTSDTPTTSCQCQDGNGEYKTLYSTFKEAEAVQKHLQTALQIYPCPTQKGWHLTKG